MVLKNAVDARGILMWQSTDLGIGVDNIAPAATPLLCDTSLPAHNDKSYIASDA